MCPQFVDFDGDGYTDIITATYEGSPFIVRGSAAGWQQPEYIKDSAGNNIRLNIYWDMEKNRWSEGDGEAMTSYAPENHLVSAAVWDSDDDGDFDLLVGSYGGLLYLHRNEGAPGNAKFAPAREAVDIAGEPFKLEGGLTAPRMVDWDGDGLTDIVTGGFKGGVYLYRNAGAPGQPKFEAAKTLLKKNEILTGSAQLPTSGLYVDPVDYDGDGDLDLLVGGYAEWSPEARVLTEAERERLKEIDAEMEEIQAAMQEVFTAMRGEIEAAESQEEIQAIYQRLSEREDYKKHNARQVELWQERTRLQPQQQREAGIWLYRRK